MLGIIQYTQDYDEFLPNGYVGSGNGTSFYFGNGWGGQIYSYVKSTGVYHCPDDPTQLTTSSTQDVNSTGNGAGTGNGPTSYPVSYGYNRNIAEYGAGFGAHEGFSDSKFNAPASTIVLFEVFGAACDITNAAGGGLLDACSPAGNGTGLMNVANSTFVTGYFPGTTGASKGYFNSAYTAGGVHTDGANYAFADGHVKWSRPSEVSAGANNTSQNCGSFPGDYSSGKAASVNVMGNSCTNGSTATPQYTFSLQ